MLSHVKATIVTPDGLVKCPVCGAVGSFTAKRTGKAKLLAVATVGVGAAAMPKRLKCNGCGENLKRGGPVKVRSPHPNSITARRARKQK
jgi:ribosomal protein S27E